jgi:hypothetical protein
MARWTTALLLLGMAAGQLADMEGFVGILETYEVGGGAVGWSLGAALVLGELTGGGLLLLSANRRRSGAAVGLGVAVVWSMLAAQAFARGLVLESCGCFGVYLAQPLRWWVLLEDAELIALTSWVRRQVAATPDPVAPPTRLDVEQASSGDAAAAVL